jgi:hypothetical protein
MKKHILLIMAVATALNIAAQNDKYHFTIETSAGLARYYNYSPLSLVEDAKGTYTAPTLSLTLGVKKNSNEFGLRYRLTNVRTSALALGESVDIHDISLLYRRSAMVSPRLELFGGVATGLSIINNHMAKVALEGTRHGLNIGLETGLRYYLGDYTYLSLTVGLDATHTFVSHNRIPDSYDPQTGRILISGRGMGGICIGIPPKVKKIKMPAALIIEGDGPILACYE